MTSALEIDISPDPVSLRLGGAAAPDPDILVMPVAGVAGPSGASGSGFNFTQVAPLASWVIVHSLNQYPVVAVRINGALGLAEVVYDSLNQVTINFARAQSGTARLV